MIERACVLAKGDSLNLEELGDTIVHSAPPSI